ncbi:hypothetical protein YC2023_102111 [Brassica napus]
MIPYVTGTCHTIIGKSNGGDASSFHLLSFLSFGFSVSTTRRAIPLASVALLSSTPRRRLLLPRKEKGDVSIDGSARGRMTAIWMESLSRWLSSAIRRCLKLWVSSTKESDDLTIGGSQRRR